MPEDAPPPAPEGDNPPSDPPPPPPPPPPADDKDWKTEAENLTREARKWEERAKANAKAAKELDDMRKASMSDQEKAISDARADAEKSAALRYGGRLVDAEIRAAAAGRNLDVPALLEGLDRSRFLTDDGEPDAKAIAKWVDRIAPPAPAKPGFPDLGQGARPTTTPADASAAMNSLLRSR